MNPTLHIVCVFGGKVTRQMTADWFESLERFSKWNPTKVWIGRQNKQCALWTDENDPAGYCYVYDDHTNSFSRAYNAGIVAAQAKPDDYVCIINPDVIFSPFWDTRLIDALETIPNCGMVQPCTNSAWTGTNNFTANFKHDPSDRDFSKIQAMAAVLSRGVDIAAIVKDRMIGFQEAVGGLHQPPVPRLSGFCLVCKQSILDAVRLPNGDYFDADTFSPIYAEDCDLTLRIHGWMNKRLIVNHRAFVYHYGRTSAPADGFKLQNEQAAKLQARIESGYYQRRIDAKN